MTMTLKECRCTPKQIELAERYGLHNSEEVLTLYPFRYEEMVKKPMNEWKEKEKVIFEGRLMTYPRSVRFGKNRSMTRFQIETEDQLFEVTIFNRPWTQRLQVGSQLTIIGRFEGHHRITALQTNAKPLNEQLGIIPVYPLKEGIQQRSLRALIKKVLLASQESLHNFVPDELIVRYQLMNRWTALRCIHLPRSMREVELARRTLKYEEFLRFHLAVQGLRNQEKGVEYIEGKKIDLTQVLALIDELPFECTEDQLQVIDEIVQDLRSNRMMLRLVQGDVGCGKTAVAWVAMAACVLAGKQAALMAPTEILARQHYESFLSLAGTFPVRIEVLYSALSPIRKKEILEKLRCHEIDILIGTHALIQDSVIFSDLGLVVADEQHRFGVEQRRKLKAKGQKVDFLLMSATPIPRTLANTLYGDMDISTIKTMPKGRKPVITRLIRQNSIFPIVSELKKKLAQREQIYVVCAAIEESEHFDAYSVTDAALQINQALGNDIHVGFLHGRMSSEEKEKVMQQFEANEIQILISTTVVEVGVNVVNATTMIIYDAHRFGLSSLHQLRGRVQRGSRQGYCYLLSGTQDADSLKRLQILVDCHDGFQISMEDLKLRGPGDILGVRQSGLPGFILGNLFEDTRIIETAKKDAMWILAHSDNPQYRHCIESLTILNENSAV